MAHDRAVDTKPASDTAAAPEKAREKAKGRSSEQTGDANPGVGGGDEAPTRKSSGSESPAGD